MKRFIFLHQVKTAGKTIEKFLLRKYGQNFIKTTNIYKDESLDNIFDILSSPDTAKRKQLSHASAISGHFPFGLHEMLGGESRYFTLLRDPVHRMRSYYAYSLKNEGSQIREYLHGKNVSFEQFVQMEERDVIESGVHELNYVLENGQTKIIAGEDVRVGQGYGVEILDKANKNLDEYFDFVGTTEFFDDSFIEISKLLGFGSFSLYITQNRSTTKVDVSENAKNIILERNKFDSKLHSHFYNEMKVKSDTFSHFLARKYLKLGSAAADAYVKVKTP